MNNFNHFVFSDVGIFAIVGLCAFMLIGSVVYVVLHERKKNSKAGLKEWLRRGFEE